MKNLHSLLMAAVMTLIVAAGAPHPVAAATDLFVKVGDIKGGSRDDNHEGWIDALSVNLGGQRGPGDTAPTFFDVSVANLLDVAMPEIFLRMANGKPVPTAVIEGIRPGESKELIFKVELFDVLITSADLNSTAAQDRGETAFRLNFKRVKWTYKEPGSDPITRGWDTEKNNEF